MPTIFIGIWYFFVYLLQRFRLSFFFFFCVTDRLLFDFVIKLITVYFLLLQLVPLVNPLMDLVDPFQLQIFQVTILNTACVSGISQYPAGTSLNSVSSTFDWSHIRIVPALIMLQGPVLQSQLMLQMMGISSSCFAVSNFLIQCTQWGIQFKSYSRL